MLWSGESILPSNYRKWLFLNLFIVNMSPRLWKSTDKIVRELLRCMTNEKESEEVKVGHCGTLLCNLACECLISFSFSLGDLTYSCCYRKYVNVMKLTTFPTFVITSGATCIVCFIKANVHCTYIQSNGSRVTRIYVLGSLKISVLQRQHAVLTLLICEASMFMSAGTNLIQYLSDKC